ncbi:CRISPR-associated protein Cmr2 [Thermosyntropha lipolytica DSM 11003]|uniref:CRISPR-associated protein Cmr2 n=1 Tax=Thermosyntropha lipolytica DSM 11003 TaxID=1123382 RepID=A0A1M5R7P9_9FIRM|nr:RAMP superfamily CRISPR-associated protein [Thermosyntropha lipolytica]SHH22100.1 CRISPR-associated protein Cmr2 [Thermosyntropha lipolytica DSM 11003]
MRFEALQQIKVKKVRNLSDYVSYCKFYYHPGKFLQINEYLNSDNKKYLLEDFPFIAAKKLDDRFKRKYKNFQTMRDFPFNWLKNEIFRSYSENSCKYLDFNNDKQFKLAKNFAGILSREELERYVDNLLPYSFVIWGVFTLKGPYFSKDDDEFYLIHNPVLKDKAFKVPMIRGSSWKGTLGNAFKDLLNECQDINRKRSLVNSYLRIFGAGSENIKVIEDYLQGSSSNLEEFKDKVLEFVLFELGMKVDKEFISEVKNEKSWEGLQKILEQKISAKIIKERESLPWEFQTHRGRTIFYPTYFDRISLEVINPHDRRRRAGKKPIFYEVVPACGTQGICQIVYVPFDGMWEDETLLHEIKDDLENLLEALEKVAENGVGAKTKLGWGSFEWKEKFYAVKGKSELNLGNYRGWDLCQE